MIPSTERMLSMKDATRLGVIQATLEGAKTAQQAAEALRLSKRHIFRLKRKVARLGPPGILHGNLQRTPTNAFSTDLRQQVIELYRNEHPHFNFTHYSEHLQEEHCLHISRQTIRRWLRAEGLGRSQRRQKVHRRRRNRKKRFGEMLFLDGSPHHWFGAEHPTSTLILATDDATGKPLWGCFVPQEDRNSCFRTAYQVFKRFGLPGCWYLDRASQFITTRHNGIHQHQSDDQPTAFEIAMRSLAIPIIFAHSPQARGRAERLNGTFQDRLVAELDHQHITHLNKATHYLNRSFIPRFCKRFARTPADLSPAWRTPPDVDLRTLLCAKYHRSVDNANTFSFKGTLYQVLPTNRRRHFVKSKLEIQEWFDHSVHAFHPVFGELKTLPLHHQGGDIIAEQRG